MSEARPSDDPGGVREGLEDQRVRFGAFELDPAIPELREAGVPVEIGATALRVLVSLVAARGDFVSNDALIEAVWSDVAVSDASLYTALREARRAVGDDGRRQEVIQTKKGRGYRFVASLEPAPAVWQSDEDILARLGADGVPAPILLGERIRSRTGGEPTLVADLVARLEAEGVRGLDAVLASESVSLSTQVIEPLVATLPPLPDPTLQVLRAAAVWGRDFSVEEVTSLELDAAAARAGLQRGTELGWIEPVPGRGRQLRFQSAAVREWLHAGIAPPKRENWHYAVSRALIAQGDLHEPAAVRSIVGHLLQAGSEPEIGELISWCQRAAEASEQGNDAEEALVHYQAALSFADAQPWEQRFTLHSLMGSLLFRESGDPNAARAAYREAAALARARNDPVRFATAALGFSGEIANTETLRFSIERLELLEAALASSAALDGATVARLQARLALDLRWTDRAGEVPNLFNDAIARVRAEPAEASDALVSVLHDAYWVSWSPDNLEARLASAEEMSQAARHSSDRSHPLVVSLLLAACHLERGDRAAAEAVLSRGAESTPVPGSHAAATLWGLGSRARFALMDGRFAEAESLIIAAREEGRGRGGSPNADAIFAAQLGWLRFDQGRLHEFGDASLVPIRTGLPLARAGTALILAYAGRSTEARGELVQLVDRIEDIPRDSFWLATLTTLVEVAARLDARTEARRLGEFLEPYANRVVLYGVRTVCRGSVSFFLGLAALTDDRSAEATKRLDTAVRANARLRAAPILARTQIEWARASVRSGRSPADVRSILTEALHTRSMLGISIEDPEIEALLGAPSS